MMLFTILFKNFDYMFLKLIDYKSEVYTSQTGRTDKKSAWTDNNWYDGSGNWTA